MPGKVVFGAETVRIHALMPDSIRPLASWPRHRADLAPAPFLPMSRAEMDALGWDACDIILVTGDAYIDHPSFGMAIIGRLLEAQGFRVGLICQPDWHSAEAFRTLGRPLLYFGVTAGNMDSMINHYTADRKPRSDDAYTAGGTAGKRPDRAVTVYAQRAREAFAGVPVVIGSIEASLRRIAHYDYWSEKVRRSVLPDSKADLLIFGNAERALVELSHRLAAGEPISQIRDLRGTAFMVKRDWLPGEDWQEIDSLSLDKPGRVDAHPDPYASSADGAAAQSPPLPMGEGLGVRADTTSLPRPSGTPSPDGNEGVNAKPLHFVPAAARVAARKAARAKTVIRLQSYETVVGDKVMYAHNSRVFHLESNPGNARALRQAHGERDVWLNPPPIPLDTAEMDYVFDAPYARAPHPSYGDARIPAWEMIRFSVNIMRGCFGGCTFCSITEHEGRIIQSRSHESILKEIEEIRDKVPEFRGHISDLGGPTANMYRMACKDPKIESSCRKLSCVYPDICENLETSHDSLIGLYRKARAIPGVKKITIGSGLRYDLAVRSPEYVKELVSHHVSGLLKIAPEHTEEGPLAKMMKPGIGSFERFRKLFDKYSKEAGKVQHLVPYFIAAHPGTTDEDMLNLALWLKANNFRPDQVQNFTPTPLAMATAMYHSGKNPLRRVSADSEAVDTPRSARQRRLHKALLRYHDPENHELIREFLIETGRRELIGNAPHQLVPRARPGLQPQGKPVRNKDDYVHALGRKPAAPRGKSRRPR